MSNSLQCIRSEFKLNALIKLNADRVLRHRRTLDKAPQPGPFSEQRTIGLHLFSTTDGISRQPSSKSFTCSKIANVLYNLSFYILYNS